MPNSRWQKLTRLHQQWLSLEPRDAVAAEDGAERHNQASQHRKRNNGINAEVDRSIDGSLPISDAASLRKGVDGQQHFTTFAVRVAEFPRAESLSILSSGNL